MTIDRGFIAMSNIRPSPIFVADAKGLDFLNSIATQVDTPVDWLGSGDDLWHGSRKPILCHQTYLKF